MGRAFSPYVCCGVFPMAIAIGWYGVAPLALANLECTLSSLAEFNQPDEVNCTFPELQLHEGQRPGSIPA